MFIVKNGILIALLCCVAVCVAGCVGGDGTVNAASGDAEVGVEIVEPELEVLESEEFTVSINDDGSAVSGDGVLESSTLVSSGADMDFGEALGGFQIAITSDKTTFKLGEDIGLHMFVRNVSDGTLAIAGTSDKASLELKRPFLHVEITKGELQDDGEFSYSCGDYPAGCAGRNYYYKVKGDEKIHSEFAILTGPDGVLLDEEGKAGMDKLSPGNYQLRLGYMGLKTHTLHSNAIHITVTDKK